MRRPIPTAYRVPSVPARNVQTAPLKTRQKKTQEFRSARQFTSHLFLQCLQDNLCSVGVHCTCRTAQLYSCTGSLLNQVHARFLKTDSAVEWQSNTVSVRHQTAHWSSLSTFWTKQYIYIYICLHFNLLQPTVTWCTNTLTFNNCTFCPHCIYVFYIYLRTNSDMCHLQHKLIGFYNRDEKCLLRGTNWVFK